MPARVWGFSVRLRCMHLPLYACFAYAHFSLVSAHRHRFFDAAREMPTFSDQAVGGGGGSGSTTDSVHKVFSSTFEANPVEQLVRAWGGEAPPPSRCLAAIHSLRRGWMG